MLVWEYIYTYHLQVHHAYEYFIRFSNLLDWTTLNFLRGNKTHIYFLMKYFRITLCHPR
jgi:hypothetical protein